MSADECWHLAVRTNTNGHSEFGPMDGLVYQSYNYGQSGVFPAFRDLIGVQYVKLVRVDDQQEAVFRLTSGLRSSMQSTILNCGQTSNYIVSPSTTEWTSAYSGVKVEGTLTLTAEYYTYEYSYKPLDVEYLLICGINEESDIDHSVLAFTSATGAMGNGWGDSWRGENQVGTIWSLFNDDYLPDRGWGSNQGYPGLLQQRLLAGAYSYALSTWWLQVTKEYMTWARTKSTLLVPMKQVIYSTFRACI
jgi:hypothetical protein